MAICIGNFMDNFIFHAYTEMLFGKGQIVHLPEVLGRYGRRVLLVYGGGSIKKNGLYDKIIDLTDDFELFELSGVEPNPRITTVEKGVSICRDHQVDVILAVGGGSTIDCAKAIGAAYYYDGNAWDIVADSRLITKVLPIVTVLTLAATGSEMNKNAVISNPATNQKLGTDSRLMIPQASFLDPEYTYTLPSIQTAAGCADIMSHVFENYFKAADDAYIQDRFAEGILKACIHYCPIALKEPENYSARANLMWASSMALNGLVGSGKGGSWSCHPMEHELSAYYDITHGVGLAILTPRWMRYILSEKTVAKFADYAVQVWDLPIEEDLFALARKGIDATERFFIDCGLPMTLSAVGIDQSKLDEMAAAAVEHGGLQNAYVPLTPDDVKQIFSDCL